MNSEKKKRETEENGEQLWKNGKEIRRKRLKNCGERGGNMEESVGEPEKKDLKFGGK